MKRLLPVVSLSLLSMLFFAVSAGRSNSAPRTIEITASRFSFEPSEISLKKGEEVTLVIHSKDVSHGLVVEGLGIRTEVEKGKSVDVKVNPSAAGTFDGKCAHFCGSGHGSMKLSVHVTE